MSKHPALCDFQRSEIHVDSFIRGRFLSEVASPRGGHLWCDDDGYRWLHPSLGFTAGWMFLCAKSASAATTSLGFAGYGLRLLGWDYPELRIPIALGVIALVTMLLLAGIR